MAKFTVELNDITKSGLKIFDFEYEFWDPTKKVEFEQYFIDHFRFREIGTETVGRFIHNLKLKCHEVLPYYNEVFKTTLLEYVIMNNYDMKENFSKTNASNRTTDGTENQNTTANSLSNTTGNEHSVAHGVTDDTKTNTESINNKKVGSDTPSSLLSMDKLEGNVYANRADVEVADNTNTDQANAIVDNTVTNDSTANNTVSGVTTGLNVAQQNEQLSGNEDYTLTRSGNIGVMHAADMIEKHILLQSKIRTVYTQFFDACEDLFMQIY